LLIVVQTGTAEVPFGRRKGKRRTTIANQTTPPGIAC